MKVVRIEAKGDHFLALDQELQVKKQNKKGHIWVDGIQRGTKQKVIEQILQPEEVEIIKED